MKTTDRKNNDRKEKSVIKGQNRDGIRNNLSSKTVFLDSEKMYKALFELALVGISIVLREKRPVKDVELGIVDENGNTFWTEVSAAPLDNEGNFAVVITQDITERKILQKLARHLEEIRERVKSVWGRVLIKGEKGSGTIIIVLIPLKNREEL